MRFRSYYPKDCHILPVIPPGRRTIALAKNRTDAVNGKTLLKNIVRQENRISFAIAGVVEAGCNNRWLINGSFLPKSVIPDKNQIKQSHASVVNGKTAVINPAHH